MINVFNTASTQPFSCGSMCVCTASKVCSEGTSPVLRQVSTCSTQKVVLNGELSIHETPCPPKSPNTTGRRTCRIHSHYMFARVPTNCERDNKSLLGIEISDNSTCSIPSPSAQMVRVRLVVHLIRVWKETSYCNNRVLHAISILFTRRLAHTAGNSSTEHRYHHSIPSETLLHKAVTLHPRVAAPALLQKDPHSSHVQRQGDVFYLVRCCPR